MKFNRHDPEEIKRRLKAAASYSKHSLGQHFLIDPVVLEAIVESAAVQPGEAVVEIGPGLGVLSEKLLETGADVTAFELDPAMVKILAEDLPTLRVVAGDVLETLPGVVEGLGEYCVVANIPYQITTPLIRLLLESEMPKPSRLVLLVQQEVGQRLAAGAGESDRSFLSVLTQYYAEVHYVRSVPAVAFWPAPKVASAVVKLVVRPERNLSPDQERSFLRFVRTHFIQRRKQLRNVVAGIRGVSTQEVGELFARLGFAPNVRAQELSEADWQILFESSKE